MFHLRCVLSWRNNVTLLTGLVIMVSIGCSSIPYRTSQNQSVCPDGTAPTYPPFTPEAKGTICVANGAIPISPNLISVPRARQTFSETDQDVPDVFVGLAISGGGSRAAVFGMAVLEQLKELGILQHITAISTTSGGGLAGAYYATKGTDIDWGDAKKKMSTNFLGQWIGKYLLPWNLASTTFTHEDRSDLMADVFDASLFNGVKYETLGKFAVGERPIWLANATDAQGGKRFTFSEFQMKNLSSSLATVPVSQAVMASAAFPGVFNSVTMSQYPPVKRDKNGKWQEPVVLYTHLIDGGPTDNLGLEALLELAASHQRVTTGRNSPAQAEGSCLILIADAYPSGDPERKMTDPDPRAWHDHIVDLNIFDAFDSLLVKQRTDILSYAAVQSTDGDGRLSRPKFVEFDMPFESGHLVPLGRLRRVGDFTADELAERFRSGKLFQPIPIPKGHFRCAAWHINLSGLQAVKPYVVDPETKIPAPLHDDLRHPLWQHRAHLHGVVSQIDTSFKLSGPNNCSPSFLLEALYAAAFVLVREDHESQYAACTWLKQAGLRVTEACGTFPGNTTLNDVPLDIIESDAEKFETGRAKNKAVRCKIMPQE